MQVIAPDGVWTPSGLEQGVVVRIDGPTIIDVSPAGRHPVDLHLPGRILIPGLVNAHSHAFQRGFRGHVQWRPEGEADDFWSWRDRMYTMANALDPDGVEAVSALAFVEMAEAGITRVGEFHYLHHAPDGTPYADPDTLALRVIAAARRVGIRIALLRVAYARGGAGIPLRDDQARFGDAAPEDVLAALERLSRITDPGVTVGLAPHSVRALDRRWLDVLGAWPGIVHAHVSEQPAENAACIAEHGRSPVAVLAAAGLVSDRFTAVHLTWPEAGDLEVLEAAGGRVCVCPSTELDLGDGFLPLDVRRRLPLCLGSDSHATIDLFAEARSLELHARGLAGRRNVLAPAGDRHGLAHRLLQAATLEGDRALGGAGRGISPGAPADLVAIDIERTAAEGMPPLEAIVFNADPSWVDTVWVAGKRIVDGGRHPDAASIRGAARPYLA